jgi:hypothetical protein
MFESARLKVDRAKQHIRELEALSRNIPDDSYTVTVEANPKTGIHSVKFSSNPLSPQFALVLGDAITNLRSSLDHVFAEATGVESERVGQSFFPIRENREGLIGSIQGRLKKRSISQPLCDLILDQVCAYQGGHPTLWALNKLANIDKHRLLIAINAIIGVTVSYTHGGATIQDCFFGNQPGKDFVLSTGPGSIQFDSKPKPSLEVRIGAGGH